MGRENSAQRSRPSALSSPMIQRGGQLGMQSTNLDLSINICTYNNRAFLQSCLTSINRELKGIDFEIIIADNASNDSTVTMLKTFFPNVIVIENPHNYGVARARNQCIRRSSGRYVLLLDADTEFVGGDFRDILTYMNSAPSIGLLGVKQVTFDNQDYPASRTFPLPKHIIFRRLAFLNFINKSKILQTHHQPSTDPTRPVEVDYVIGAFQVIKREVIDLVGWLDESMFYGFEDADYCARVKKSGFKVIYYPLFTIRHYVQGMTRKNVFNKLALKLLFSHFKSYVRFYTKHHDLLH
jgi:GT2 family glycosyltransferase